MAGRTGLSFFLNQGGTLHAVRVTDMIRIIALLSHDLVTRGAGVQIADLALVGGR